MTAAARKRSYARDAAGEIELAASPIIKSAGGKTKLLPVLLANLPPSGFGRYIEPFLGGGALFFALSGMRDHGVSMLGDGAILADASHALMEMYVTVAHDPDAVLALVRDLVLERAATNATEHYYRIRREWNDATAPADDGPRSEWTPAHFAAAFLYLNHHCYNGLWRVNKRGAFNVPIGKYAHPSVCSEPELRAVARELARPDVTLIAGDYRQATRLARPGDLVYFDPPYDASFTAYTKGGFRISDQKELAEEATRLAHAGVHVMFSNHDTPAIRELYSAPHWHVQKVQAPRAISCKGKRRRPASELLITSYGEARHGRWYKEQTGLAL